MTTGDDFKYFKRKIKERGRFTYLCYIPNAINYSDGFNKFIKVWGSDARQHYHINFMWQPLALKSSYMYEYRPMTEDEVTLLKLTGGIGSDSNN